MEFNLTTIDLHATGKNIYHARKRAGLSVHDLQEAMGLEAPNAIYRWQRGESLPRLDHLVLLASLLHVPMDDLISVRINNQ